MTLPDDKMSEEMKSTSLRRSLTSHFVLQVVELGAQLYFCYYLRGRSSLQVAHSVLLLASLLAFNGLSLVWVCRGLDFAGRRCGKVVCYLMHAALLAHVWRYLKLRLAFDAADVAEFRLLRLAQVHIQTLPLTTLQVGIVLWSQALDIRALGAIGLQLVFAAASISLPISAESAPQANGQVEDKCVSVSVLKKCLTCVQVSCFLWSRLVACAAFAIVFHFWLVLVALCHCLVSFLWLRTLGCSDNVQPSSGRRNDKTGRQTTEQTSLLHCCFSAYVLMFYLHLHCIKSKRDLFGVVTFHVLTTLENVAKILLWCYYSPQPLQFKMDTACVAGVGTLVGALLLVLLTTCRLCNCTSGLLKASEGGICLPWTPHSQVTWTKSEQRERPTNTYINIREIQHVLGATRRVPNAKDTNRDTRTPTSASWKADIVSPGWSTDNGSSNSRNTNTLEAGQKPGGVCVGDDNPPESVTSFSSLSCGTVTKKDGAPESAPVVTAPSTSEPPPRTCHCTMFDTSPTSYGIYIWGDKSTPGTKPPGLFHAQKRLQVVCATCLHSHDPLLTDCQVPQPDSSTTDYPSPSECTGYYPDSVDSCTTWPSPPHNMASLLRADFSGLEYVRAWLMSSDPPRGGQATPDDPGKRRRVRRRQVRRRYRARSSSLPSRQIRRKARSVVKPPRRCRPQTRPGLVINQPNLRIVQDIETIV